MPGAVVEDSAEGSPALPHQVLRQVAAWMLPGASAPQPVPAGQAEALVELAVRHGLSGPLVACLDAGAIEVPKPVYRHAIDTHEASLWWCLLVERRLLEIDRWFRDAGGVDYRVVKGPAVAHLDEVDPSLRSYGDLDLLVAGPSMDRVLDVLVARGAVRARPAQRPGFDARFAKGVGTRFADGIEVDVHRSFCGGAHGFRIPLDRVFAAAERFQIGGRPLPAPAKAHRALHACYHAVIGSPTPPLRTLRDLGWYLSDIDLTPVVLAAEAQAWRGEAVLAQAVRITLDTLDLPLPTWRAWLARTRIDPAELRLIDKDREPTNLPFRWSTVRELRWPDRAAFAWAVAFPAPEVLRARGQTPFSRVRTGIRRFRS
jgi:hypothetical protein